MQKLCPTAEKDCLTADILCSTPKKTVRRTMFDRRKRLSSTAKKDYVRPPKKNVRPPKKTMFDRQKTLFVRRKTLC